MYFIEFLIKKFKELKNKKNRTPVEPGDAVKDCDNHIYLPVDSTKKYLACKNCGHIIRNTYDRQDKK